MVKTTFFVFYRGTLSQKQKISTILVFQLNRIVVPYIKVKVKIVARNMLAKDLYFSIIKTKLSRNILLIFCTVV